MLGGQLRENLRNLGQAVKAFGNTAEYAEKAAQRGDRYGIRFAKDVAEIKARHGLIGKRGRVRIERASAEELATRRKEAAEELKIELAALEVRQGRQRQRRADGLPSLVLSPQEKIVRRRQIADDVKSRYDLD